MTTLTIFDSKNAATVLIGTETHNLVTFNRRTDAILFSSRKGRVRI